MLCQPLVQKKGRESQPQHSQAISASETINSRANGKRFSSRKTITFPNHKFLLMLSQGYEYIVWRGQRKYQHQRPFRTHFEGIEKAKNGNISFSFQLFIISPFIFGCHVSFLVLYSGRVCFVCWHRRRRRLSTKWLRTLAPAADEHNTKWLKSKKYMNQKLIY